MDILIKDMARAAMEKATGGKRTILYSQKGTPNVMCVIPRYTLDSLGFDIGHGDHPAFTAGGVSKSNIFIGAYQTSLLDSEPVSLPGRTPIVGRGMDAHVLAAKSLGVGWHVMTNTEWAAIALQCQKNGLLPYGNNWWGASSENNTMAGVRVDGSAPGTTSGSGYTKTGSGPELWNHDHTPFGIADLNGNVWEWTPGLRLVRGEVQVLVDASLDTSAESTAWRAIDATNGNYIVPTVDGAGVPTTVNSVRIAASGTTAGTIVATNGGSFGSVSAHGLSTAAQSVLKVLGVFPVGPTNDSIFHGVQMNEASAVRGGNWTSLSGSGVFCLSLANNRTNTDVIFGSRLAYL